MARKWMDIGSIVTVAKGLPHELLLEAGVFLVSVKLVLAAYKQSAADRQILAELRERTTPGPA